MSENRTEPKVSERQLYLQRRRRQENWFAVVLTVSLLIMLLYQAGFYLYQNQKLAWLGWELPLENWYGASYDEVLPTVKQTEGLWGVVTLQVQDYSELKRACVLINGVQAGNFTSQTLTLRVFAGDIVEIDCSSYGRPVYFRLIKASSGIDRSALKSELILNGQRGSVGQIKFK